MNVVALKPASANPRIIKALVAVSKQTRAVLGIRLASIGLATGEDDVILAMSNGRPVCAEQLSRRIGISQQTLHRLMQELVARGYVEIVERPLFRLSQKGTESIAHIEDVRTRIASEIEAMIGVDGIEKLADYLETVEDGFSLSLKSTV